MQYWVKTRYYNNYKMRAIRQKSKLLNQN